MRKTPIYQLDDNIASWLEKNSNLIFDEILESAEEAYQSKQRFSSVPVIILETPEGTTLFSLKSKKSMVEGLEKAIKNFVEREEYEKAVRVKALQEVLQEEGIDD